MGPGGTQAWPPALLRRGWFLGSGPFDDALPQVAGKTGGGAGAVVPPTCCFWQSTFVPHVRGGGPLPLQLCALPVLPGAVTVRLFPGQAERGSGLSLGAQAHLRGVGAWSEPGPVPQAWGNPGLEPPPKQLRGGGPTPASEASGSSSSFDTGCCSSGLLGSAGHRVPVRPGRRPAGPAEAQASLFWPVREGAWQQYADGDTEAQGRLHSDSTSRGVLGLAAVTPNPTY